MELTPPPPFFSLASSSFTLMVVIITAAFLKSALGQLTSSLKFASNQTHLKELSHYQDRSMDVSSLNT